MEALSSLLKRAVLTPLGAMVDHAYRMIVCLELLPLCKGTYDWNFLIIKHASVIVFWLIIVLYN